MDIDDNTATCSMVDDPSTDNSIRWLAAGDGFLLVNAEVFAKDVLPLYFKHNNFATFVRQLNMYDFSKVRGGYCSPMHVR